MGYEWKTAAGASAAPTGKARPGLRTTSRMLIWAAVLVAAVTALCAVPAADVGGVRDGFGAIGSRSGPGVVAAAQLYDDLAEMDGAAAAVLEFGDATAFTAARSAAYQAFEDDRTDADSRLEVLGAGLGAGPGGAVPGTAAAYTAVENGLGQYTEVVSQAVYIDEQAHGQTVGVPPADALARFQAGTGLMHKPGTGLLAEAQTLLTADQGTVSDAYYGAFGTIGRLRIWGILLTALLVIVLIVVQVKISRQFKRRLNPALAAATVLSVIFGVLLFSALDAAHADYVTQKADAFDSVVALWQDRGTAADMAASESRWLLDRSSPTAAGQVEAAAEQSLFGREESQEAAEPGVSESGAGYAEDLDAATKTLADEVLESDVPRLAGNFTGGYLGTELVNVTFNGEQGAADAAFDAYDRFIDDDGHFRGLFTVPDSAAAAVAYQTGTSDRDYAAYTAALDRTIGINQQQYAAAGERGADGLGPWLWMPVGWALATVALILLGFLPRLREYRRG